MRLVQIAPITVTVELNLTDCLQLYAALAREAARGSGCDFALCGALGNALLAASVCAAFDTIQDSKVPEAAMLAHVRAVWGPRDSSTPRHPVASPPDGRG